MKRYYLLKGGDDEPDLLLIKDHCSGYIIARSSEMVKSQISTMVDLANRAWERGLYVDTPVIDGNIKNEN